MEDALEEPIKVENEIDKLKKSTKSPLPQKKKRKKKEKKKKKQKQKQKEKQKTKALNFQNAIRVLKGSQKLRNGIESGIFSIENHVRKL